MAAIPAAAAEEQLRKAVVIEEGAPEPTPCTLFQVGLLNEPLRQLRDDIAGLKAKKGGVRHSGVGTAPALEPRGRERHRQYH